MTTPPLPYFKVLEAPLNGGKIAGRKGRKLNDVFQAAEAMVRFQVLEGIVGECSSTGVLVSSGGSSSSSSSGGGSSSGNGGASGG